MTTKVERKTRLCCCLIVPSKSPGGHAIYHLNAWVLEMQNFSTAYEGTEDFFRTKIYWMYNRTTANDHLSTTTTALRRPLFWLLRTKNHTWLLYKNSLQRQRQLSTVPKMAVVIFLPMVLLWALAIAPLWNQVEISHSLPRVSLPFNRNCEFSSLFPLSSQQKCVQEDVSSNGLKMAFRFRINIALTNEEVTKTRQNKK